MWLRTSDLMKVMANSIGAPYLNVIHPNPYHSKKVLTEAETAMLNLPDTDLMVHGISVGYALIESRADLLKSRGIVSGMALFDEIPDTIYADSAGHLGKRGETMLADFVANQVGSRLRSPRNK